MEKEPKDMNEKNTLKRRTLLKALAGIPVLGYFAFETLRKLSFDRDKKSRVVKELGLDDIKAPKILTGSSGKKGDLVRIGIIGFGARAVAHSNGLGYIHPNDVETRENNGTLEDWLAQEDLNVAITGICDVFDLHAENGFATANNPLRQEVQKPRIFR